MTTDSISGLQDELEAALAVLEPQIRGVEDLSLHPISQELGVALTLGETSLKQRRGFIQQVLDDIKKLLDDLQILENDGYPVPKTFELSDTLLGELKSEVDEVEQGSGVFHAGMATALEISFGTPIPKPPLPAR